MSSEDLYDIDFDRVHIYIPLLQYLVRASSLYCPVLKYESKTINGFIKKLDEKDNWNDVITIVVSLPIFEWYILHSYLLRSYSLVIGGDKDVPDP